MSAILTPAGNPAPLQQPGEWGEQLIPSKRIAPRRGDMPGLFGTTVCTCPTCGYRNVVNFRGDQALHPRFHARRSMARVSAGERVA